MSSRWNLGKDFAPPSKPKAPKPAKPTPAPPAERVRPTAEEIEAEAEAVAAIPEPEKPRSAPRPALSTGRRSPTGASLGGRGLMRNPLFAFALMVLAALSFWTMSRSATGQFGAVVQTGNPASDFAFLAAVDAGAASGIGGYAEASRTHKALGDALLLHAYAEGLGRAVRLRVESDGRGRGLDAARRGLGAPFAAVEALEPRAGSFEAASTARVLADELHRKLAAATTSAAQAVMAASANPVDFEALALRLRLEALAGIGAAAPGFDRQGLPAASIAEAPEALEDIRGELSEDRISGLLRTAFPADAEAIMALRTGLAK